MKKITQLLIPFMTFLWMSMNVFGSSFTVSLTSYTKLDLQAYDTVWVNSKFTVDSLIIDQGTQVIFNGNFSININYAGVVSAIGTSASPIVFKPANAAVGLYPEIHIQIL
jgi:hypothetical protein